MKWIPSWRYVPINYAHDMGVFENITQKCVLTNNLAGDRIRLRFNNRYSDQPLVIDHVSVALHNRVTGEKSPLVPVTLNGEKRIVLPADSAPYSDELELSVTAEEDFLVYMYFGEKFAPRCVVTTSTAIGWQSTHHTGDYAVTDALGPADKFRLAEVLARDPYPCHFAAGLCEVAVHTVDDVQLIALFGDSITHMSFFMDPFMERVYRRFPGKVAVMNAGIAGNRAQKPYPNCPELPGEGAQFGMAGVDRFARDVYEGAHPDIVFLMEGVNDCTHSLAFGEPEVPKAWDIFAALSRMAGCARERGSRVYMSTIAPFGCFGEFFREAAEELRQQTNALIRGSHVADGIVDMDEALRDPGDSHRMQEGFHMGDGVHPNWHGGCRMAETLIRTLFPE